MTDYVCNEKLKEALGPSLYKKFQKFVDNLATVCECPDIYFGDDYCFFSVFEEDGVKYLHINERVGGNCAGLYRYQDGKWEDEEI